MTQDVLYLESGYLVSVARLLVYMCPPTSMCTGALDLVSCAGRGMPWAARGETGDRVRESRDMLRPSWKQVYKKAIQGEGRGRGRKDKRNGGERRILQWQKKKKPKKPETISFLIRSLP